MVSILCVTILNHGLCPKSFLGGVLLVIVIFFSSKKSVDTFDTFCHHFFGQKRLTDQKNMKK